MPCLRSRQIRVQVKGSYHVCLVRLESSVTSLTWIPLEAVEGAARFPWNLGLAHYDAPPPDLLVDLEELRRGDRFRFANELRAAIEVEDGRIVSWVQEGGGHIGATTIRGMGRSVTVPAFAYPDLRPDPVVTRTSVRFVQTSGGRTGLPMPRLSGLQVHLAAPPAWTTLSLTLHVDGRAEPRLEGASPFPRHWVYDQHGRLVSKSGLIEFVRWARIAPERGTPWGGIDTPALATAVETAIERGLSVAIIDAKPKWRRLGPGETLVEQGDEGGDVFLLFDGMLAVEVGGAEIASLGPGAIVGEMALISGGRRTATLRAITTCRVAIAPPDGLDRQALANLAAGRYPGGEISS